LPDSLNKGLTFLEERIFNSYDLLALIEAYKAIFTALYPTVPVSLKSCPNPKFKKVILAIIGSKLAFLGRLGLGTM
jgi:hypothetical protein